MSTTMLLWLVSPFVAQAVHLGRSNSIGIPGVVDDLKPPSDLNNRKTPSDLNNRKTPSDFDESEPRDAPDDVDHDMRPTWAQTGYLNERRPSKACTPTKLNFTPKSSQPAGPKTLIAEDGIFHVNYGTEAKTMNYEIVAEVKSGAMALRELGLKALGENVRIAVFNTPERTESPLNIHYGKSFVSFELGAPSPASIRIDFGTCVPSIVFRMSEMYSFVLTQPQWENSYWQLPQGFSAKPADVKVVAEPFGDEQKVTRTFGGQVRAYFPTLPDGYSVDDPKGVTEAFLINRTVFTAKSVSEDPQSRLALPAVTAGSKSEDPLEAASKPSKAKSLPPAKKKGLVKRFVLSLSEKLKRKKDAVKRGLTKFANMFRSKKTKS